MPPSPPAKLRSRSIQDADLAQISALLAKGFPNRSRGYWANALSVLQGRAAPEGYPRYGYLLEDAGQAVGVVLLIFTPYFDGGSHVRCNISSWYVEPRYRPFAAIMSSPVRGLPDVTYLNTSPAANTWPIIEARGYRRYSSGQFACIPSLSPPHAGERVEAYDPDLHADRMMDVQEARMLLDHVKLGCRVVVCRDDDRLHPFIFIPRRVQHLPLPALQLAYCRDTVDFIRLAGVIGRHFLRRGALVVIFDANEHVRELTGRYFENRSPKYFKGPVVPRLNDLAYTEATFFGG